MFSNAFLTLFLLLSFALLNINANFSPKDFEIPENEDILFNFGFNKPFINILKAFEKVRENSRTEVSQECYDKLKEIANAGKNQTTLTLQMTYFSGQDVSISK